jgi:hypothetical protein
VAASRRQTRADRLSIGPDVSRADVRLQKSSCRYGRRIPSLTASNCSRRQIQSAPSRRGEPILPLTRMSMPVRQIDPGNSEAGRQFAEDSPLEEEASNRRYPAKFFGCPVRSPVIRLPQHNRPPRDGYRWFESISLQRVISEPAKQCRRPRHDRQRLLLVMPDQLRFRADRTSRY